ncbi:MAG: helix-turn-helix domain-containing protein [Desulfovibrio sp.]|uniref:helix-turn-helix domain-containing protein n=1 Tax=Desulfovibrio sp. TaxID=885 RepID=UPI00135E535A|nr:helix-turn-helix domain-containing protein [Desulfovibrio sp.]MTJ93967.1 helix-turn-helix domain-containing protein [Desulfovibrio sp.]
MSESESERKRIGAQLAARRKEKKWTVKDVAARTGRQPSRVTEMEKGRTNSTLDALIQVGEVMGLRLLYVPEDRMADVLMLLGQRTPTLSHATMPRSVFDEVFIPDPEDGDDEAPDH